LKRLFISYNDISDPAIFEDLKFGLSKSVLEELDLSNNNLGDIAAKYLA
jgi:hypothetical protein